jgi:hypothetical protein
MPSIRGITLGIFALNLLAVTFLTFNQYGGHSSNRVLIGDFKPINGSYYFDDPTAAYNLLSKLDIFEIIEDGVIKGANYNSKVMGLKPDFDYCDKHRAYFVENPEFVFAEKTNFITNFAGGHKFMWQVIPKIGKDVTPRFRKEKDQFYDTPLNANIYFIFNLFFFNRQVGKQYSCLTQNSNHIAGHENLYRKDKASDALVAYAKAYETRQQCFGFDKYFPKTWVLRDKEQCEEFFEEFLSPKYQQLKKERNIVYFRKIGADVHEGKGVFPVGDAEEAKIQKLYKNGSACGVVKDNNLIQYNVHNLLLVQNRKFGFRSFLLVASTNPLIAYYHDGYARLSLNSYNAKSNDTSTFVTNIGVNLKNTEFGNWTNQQIQDYTYWPLEKFAAHMLEAGHTNDSDWLNNYLRKEFMKVKIHLIRMAHKTFARKSSLFETYGLDYVMDEHFNLWFIEANTMPLIDGFTAHSTELLNTMMMDTFEIVRGLTKSRMKRVIFYINNLLRTEGEEPKNLEARREEFRKLTMNRFEPEFMPSPTNSFYPIIDENLQGTATYMDLIPKECLEIDL